MAQEGLDKGSLADLRHRFELGPGQTRVRPGSDLGLTWVCLPYFWFDHLAVASWGFSTNLFWRKKINCIFNYDMSDVVPDQGPVWLRFSGSISNIHSVSPWSEQCIIMHLPALYVNHILPDIKSFNIQQVVMLLVETILSLHVEDFQPTFFVKRKCIGYSIL